LEANHHPSPDVNHGELEVEEEHPQGVCCFCSSQFLFMSLLSVPSSFFQATSNCILQKKHMKTASFLREFIIDTIFVMHLSQQFMSTGKQNENL
jgi:hypothetical protein